MIKKHPTLIQGGMGIAVSGWPLAKVVSRAGHLGVVSGTAINSVLVRRLQDGDPQGDNRRAISHFPQQSIAQKILDQYFIEGGIAKGLSYKRAPLFSIQTPLSLLQLNVLASFVEVWLAKEGHSGLVGFNLLEKVQIPNISALYGAMLADVDYVIMGAGIPREIPGVLDLLSENKIATLKIPVVGATEEVVSTFDPRLVMESNTEMPRLKRPYFFPIVSSSTLAMSLKKKSTGTVDGFIVEGPLAGGHNAPPRGQMQLNSRGEPIYGPRDQVDLVEMINLGLPFWMAGDFATPEKMKTVMNQGAHGIQVGTLFAFANESGLDARLRSDTIKKVLFDKPPVGGWVFTDPRSSPTSFPFKAVQISGSISETAIYEARKRICDLGYLRHAYKKDDGSIGQRCPAEPVADYVKKGGLLEDTIGRKCLCNALMTDIGLGQIQADGKKEVHLLTAGDDLNNIFRIIRPGMDSYSAMDVIDYLFQTELDKQKSRSTDLTI